MSFAGPKDPSLERALKLAYDKGIVLIAAAGNAGPKSPPLFPGADPNVIAVTATDVDDKLFTGANRGKYISVAAPGVDILVPAPEGTYQLTTGTSVAAAEVSGIVALLLERNPKLTPGRHPPHPDRERKAARAGRARRRFRLRPDRSAQGAAARRAAHRGRAPAAAVERTAASPFRSPCRVTLDASAGTVGGGAATIQGQGSAAVTVNQSTSSAIINLAHVQTRSASTKPTDRSSKASRCNALTNRAFDHSVMAITATEIICRHAPRIKRWLGFPAT